MKTAEEVAHSVAFELAHSGAADISVVYLEYAIDEYLRVNKIAPYDGE